MRAVLDSSVAVKWVLAEKDSDRARPLRDGYRQGQHALIAPDWFVAEVANVLGKAAARKTITAAEAAQGYADILNDAPVLHQSRVFVDTRLFNSLSTPARRLRLPLFGAGLRPKIATSV